MPIDSIHSVYTVVRDMERSQAFYAKALGLPISFRDGNAWCQFAAGTTHFALASSDEAASGARGSVPVFRSHNLAYCRRSIEEAGGQVMEQRDMGSHGSVLTCSDPDRNIFQILARITSP